MARERRGSIFEEKYGRPVLPPILGHSFEPGKETDLREISLVVKNVDERAKSKNKFKCSKTVEARHNYKFYAVILFISKTTTYSYDLTTLINKYIVELGKFSVCHKTLILEPNDTFWHSRHFTKWNWGNALVLPWIGPAPEKSIRIDIRKPWDNTGSV